MNKTIKILATSAAILCSTSAFAENQPDNPWTDCGIGYMIFQDSEIGAAISNVIWDAGTTATTTFVSSPDNCRSRDAEVAKFIGESYDSLENETAVGTGSHLDALVEVAQCESSHQSALITVIRSDFGSLSQLSKFESMSRVEKAEAYFDIVSSHINGDFKNNCSHTS